MKCTRILLIIALIGTQACKQSETPQANVPPPQSGGVPSIPCEKAIATQNRINRYFHNAVLPKLKNCWQGVKGQGAIAIEFNYKRGGSDWATEAMKIQTSTLPEGQQAVAFKCLQDSVQGTSFPVEEGDGSAQEFFVNWSWPVPLPKDINAVAQRMIDTGGGRGCGGSEGPGPACWDCLYVPFIGVSYCGRVCAGYKDCRPTASGCNLGPIEPRCVTGSLYGNIGGIVMY
jgi:hypothetical protein